MTAFAIAAHGCFQSVPDQDDDEDEDSESDTEDEDDSTATDEEEGEGSDSDHTDPDVGEGSTGDSVDGGETGSDSTSDDDASDSGEDSGSDSTGGTDGTDDGNEVVVFPLQVTECGEGFLDEIDHAIGDPFGRVEDDVRTGSCLPDVCAVQGESGMNGVDLVFRVGLEPLLPLTSASFRVRGVINGGAAGTTEFYLPGTTTRVARCTIDTDETEYGECVAVVEEEFLDMIGRDDASFYTTHGDPGCYFVYDFIELTVRY